LHLLASGPFFALVIFWIGSCFYAQVGLDPKLSTLGFLLIGMTGLEHHTQLFIGLLTVCLGWPRTVVFLISASQVARTSDVSHHTRLIHIWELSV
jgi:hypothetical protein